MGNPTKISFTKNATDKTNLIQTSFSETIFNYNKFTEVVARTETSKGTIRSKFLIASEIKTNRCTLRTDYNYPALALPDRKTIEFQQLLRNRKETREGGANLPDSLRRFHHWLVSEIAQNLNHSGYFSELHLNIETQCFELEIMPTLREQIRVKVWGLAESD
ncbi:hypothetical protein [Pseudomonas izuensis]|uniref:hypothetical protein n=1 Tax=Pseudomonas izuensis TaxID=2684212 RepID=UPI00135C49A4|nr:hypothetical protein [Pseudomonas izuensis]